MVEYTIKFSKQAIKDKTNIIKNGLQNTTTQILDLMCENPFIYPPSFEKLTGKLTGYYSRRINRQHRIVYMVNEKKKEIYIIRLWTHYEKIN